MQSSAGRAEAALPNSIPSTPDPSAVELVNVCRRFGEVAAVEQVSLSIRSGEFFSLLGPSGCGKTTLLRLIAGLDLPGSGAVWIHGMDATSIPAHRRPVNTVFQSYALFPHLNVRENVAFGLRMKKVHRAEIDSRVHRVMELARISELAARRPAQLSGGQKQRVALARAIVNEPQVLLLDEPLGALDLKLRRELQGELRALQRRLGITFIHVTHDQEEALAMSDRIGVMEAGRLDQVGPAEEIYERPRTRFVAQFLGSCNLVEGTVRRSSGRTVWADTLFGELQAEVHPTARLLNSGGKCTFALRPEKVRLVRALAPAETNCVPARITGLTYSGAETEYRLEARGTALTARALNGHAASPPFCLGEAVAIQVSPSAWVLLEDSC